MIKGQHQIPQNGSKTRLNSEPQAKRNFFDQHNMLNISAINNNNNSNEVSYVGNNSLNLEKLSHHPSGQASQITGKHLESSLGTRKPYQIEEQQNLPFSHMKRNEDLKNEFVFRSQALMNKDQEMHSKQSEYTNILAAIAYQNQARETKLKQLNDMLQRNNQNSNSSSVFSIENSQSFISEAKSGQSQLQLFNPIMLAQRILKIQEEIKNVHSQIEIQEEKIEEHTHMVSEIKKSSLHKTEEIHDLTSLTQQYSQQAKDMEKKVLSMGRKISTSSFQQQQAVRVIDKESAGNTQRIEEYRQSAEELAFDVKEELKLFNKIEDRKCKLEKKLGQTRAAVESLLFEQKRIISKQEKQCALIKDMNAFNVLARMFVYENPSDIENVENAFELATEKLAENDKDSDQLYLSSSGRSKAMIVKEEIMKFEELHQNNVELIVGKLAKLFQELTRAHDTMSMRCEDLLLQKKRLLTITNQLTTVEVENDDTNDNNRQIKQILQMQMDKLPLLGEVQRGNPEREQENVKISVRDTINIQQLAEQTFLFLTRILSKLAQLLRTLKVLLDKACSSNKDHDKQVENIGQNGSESCRNTGDTGRSKAQIDLKMAVQERSVEETPDNSMEIEKMQHQQQYQTCSRLIAESSKGLFQILEEVSIFLSTSRSQMLRELQSEKSPSSHQIKEFMDLDEDQSKTDILETMLESKMSLGEDNTKGFFEFIKNDFIINNFCSLKDFECFFTDLSNQTGKNSNESGNTQGDFAVILKNKMSDLHGDRQEKEKQKMKNLEKLEMILERSGELRQAGRANYERILDQHVSYILRIITVGIDLSSAVKSRLEKRQEEDAKILVSENSTIVKSRAQSISEQRQEIMLRKISQMDQKKGKGREQQPVQRIDIKKKGKVENSRDYQNRSITDKERSQIDQGDLLREESIVSSPTFYREDQVPEVDVHRRQSRDQNELDDSVDDGSDQNDQGSIEVIVEEKQNPEGQNRNESFQTKTESPRKSNNYMNTKQRDVRLSQEARQMWKKIKSFQENTHSFQPLPPISASEIRSDFETQRATLHLHHVKKKPTPIMTIQSARTEKETPFSELKLLIMQKQQQIAQSQAKRTMALQEDQQNIQNCSTSMLGQYSPAFKTTRQGGSSIDFSKIQQSFTTTQTHLSPLKSTVSRSNSQSYLHSSQRPSPLLSKRNSGEQLTQKDISHRRVKSNILETSGNHSNKLINSQLLVPLSIKETQKPYSLVPTTKSIFQNETKLNCKNNEKTNSSGNLTKPASKGFVVPPVNQDSLSRRALKEEIWNKSTVSERNLLQRELIMNAYLPHKISTSHKRGNTFAEISSSSFIKTSRHLNSSQTDLDDIIPPYDGNRLKKIYNV